MQPFEYLSGVVFDKLHDKTGFDDKSKEYINLIIDNAVNLVAHLVNRRNKDADEKIKEELSAVATNTAIFLAMVIVQLEFFGRGENDGPFFDMIKEMLNDTKNSNSSGHTSKE
jgi:hypothetical protein